MARDTDGDALRRENAELRRANGELTATLAERDAQLAAARAETASMAEALEAMSSHPAPPPAEAPSTPAPGDRRLRAKYLLRARTKGGQEVTVKPGDVLPEDLDLSGIDPADVQEG